MPDIFVARDTTEYTPYLNKILNYGYLYQFAFNYTDKHRSELKKFRKWEDLDKYLSSQTLLPEFTQYASNKGIKPDSKQISKSAKIMNNLLHAYISRNILGDDGFYPLFLQYDPTVLKAVDVLSKK